LIHARYFCSLESRENFYRQNNSLGLMMADLFGRDGFDFEQLFLVEYAGDNDGQRRAVKIRCAKPNALAPERCRVLRPLWFPEFGR
jgi:hypothetical protein